MQLAYSAYREDPAMYIYTILYIWCDFKYRP